MSLRFFHRDGTPCGHPAQEHRTRPVHIELSTGDLGRGNHLSVAWTGEEHIIKASKAYDLWDVPTFEKWIAALSNPQKKLIDSALSHYRAEIENALDIDWTTGDVQEKIAQASARINALMTGAWKDSPLEKEVGGILQGILEHAPEKFSERYEFLGLVKAEVIDEKALRFFTNVSQTASKESIGKWIDPDRKDRWLDAVGKAVKDGRSSDEIAAGLVGDVNGKIKGNKLAYSRLVADQLMVRARSYSEIRSMQSAGFEECQWLSVLDSVCCMACRLLQGTVISIPAAYAISTSTFDYSPDALAKTSPWISQKGNDLFVGKKKIATETRSGKGNWNDVGEFTRHHEGPLTDLKVGMPPSHAMCRCTTVPVFSTRGVPVTNPFARSPAVKAEGAESADAERMSALLQAEDERFKGWMLTVGALETNVSPLLVRRYLEEQSAAVEDGQPWQAGAGLEGKAAWKTVAGALGWFRGARHPEIIVALDPRIPGALRYVPAGPVLLLSGAPTEALVVHGYMHHVVASNPWLASRMARYAEKRGAAPLCDPWMSEGKAGEEILPTAAAKLTTAPRMVRTINADLFLLALAVMRGAT